MRFRLPDGEEIQGRSYEDIVKAMSGYKMVEPRSLQSYMRATARRTADMHKVMIDAGSPTSFVLSLEGAGLLERLS